MKKRSSSRGLLFSRRGDTSQEDEVDVKCLGYLLLASTFVFFCVCSYASVVSKILPRTGHPLLDWIADDTYFCLAVPLSLPVALLAVYFNWLGLKLFMHN